MLKPAKYEAHPWLPTPKEAAYLAAMESTLQFVDNLPSEVIVQYGGQWIAVKDAAIIAAAPTRAELSALLGDRDEDTVLKVKIEKGINIRWRRPS
jgi:hypothetical protein